VGNTFITAHNASKTLAAQTSHAAALTSPKSTLAANTSIENIVDLQPILDSWATTHKGQNWAVVAKSITGPTFDAKINPDRSFESASIYKLFLTLPLFTQIPVEQQANINVVVPSGQKSIATCVDLMLRISNNECGQSIGYYLNWKKADATLKEAGFTHTEFNKSDNLKTTAGDTAAFLDALNDSMFNRKARETIMKSLYQQRYRDGIPAGCPGCVVANKTGQIDNVMHDAAIVQYKGGTYILVIFSENGTFKQISQLTGQIQQRIIDSTNR
jgi:beta-lactamase class A